MKVVTMKCIHCATERFVIHFWKAPFKVEDRDDKDNEDVIFHATKPSMASCVQKIIHLYFDYLFFLHTFVVLVYSLRTVDLTRNMTEGKGTGQVNINPDRRTNQVGTLTGLRTQKKHKGPHNTYSL